MWTDLVIGGRASEETVSGIQKSRVIFANLRHLWRRRDIRSSIKGRVYTTAVKSLLLYGSETWQNAYEEFRCLKTVVFIASIEYGGKLLWVTRKLGIRY